MSEDIDKLRVIVAEDPGADSFVELAELLASDPITRPEARELCLRGLSKNPSNNLGRLTLAKLYYLDCLFEFSLRELLELKRLQSRQVPSLEKLISAFGPMSSEYGKVPPTMTDTSAASVSEAESTVAEIDLDIDFLEAAEDLQSE